MAVAVIGDEGSGKSIFITLMYATQIRYTAGSDGDFRFFASPKDLQVISKEYNRMRMGSWPSDELLGKDIRYSCGFRMKQSTLKRLFGSRQKHVEIEFRVLATSSSEFEPMKTGEIDDIANIPARAQEMIQEPIWLFLVEASRNDLKPWGRLVSNMIGHAPSKPQIIVMFTMTDKANTRGGIPKRLPLDRKVRNELGRSLINKRAGEVSRLWDRERVYGPEIFFSEVQTTDQKGKPVPKLDRNESGSFEMAYSYDQYQALLGHLGDIARVLDQNV